MKMQEIHKLLDAFVSEHFIEAQTAGAGIAAVEDIAKFVKRQQYERGLSKIRGIINRRS